MAEVLCVFLSGNFQVSAVLGSYGLCTSCHRAANDKVLCKILGKVHKFSMSLIATVGVIHNARLKSAM